jgi:hypothetical protein
MVLLIFVMVMCLYVIFVLYLRAPLVCMFPHSCCSQVYVTFLLWALCVIVSSYLSLLWVCVLLSVVKFVQCLKYGVVCLDVYVAHTQVVPLDVCLLPVLMKTIVCVIVPYVCPIFNICFEHPELLLFLIT